MHKYEKLIVRQISMGICARDAGSIPADDSIRKIEDAGSKPVGRLDRACIERMRGSLIGKSVYFSIYIYASIEVFMIKLAGLEDTEVTDPKTGLKIRVSTTTRKMYRYIYSGEEHQGMRNIRLNQIIATDFAGSADGVVHHFKLGKVGDEDRAIAEIRKRAGTSMFFISTRRDSYIDILTFQSAYKSPKLKVSDTDTLLDEETSLASY